MVFKLNLSACLFWYVFHVRVFFPPRFLIIFDFQLLIKNESLKANREL